MLTFPGHGSPSVKATSLRIALLSENGGNEYPQKRRVLVKLSDRQGMIRPSMQFEARTMIWLEPSKKPAVSSVHSYREEL